MIDGLEFVYVGNDVRMDGEDFVIVRDDGMIVGFAVVGNDGIVSVVEIAFDLLLLDRG